MGGCEVVSIACGGSHSGAVTNSGRTFLWGLNRSGQCGIGFKTDSIPEPTPIEVRLEANDRIKSLALSRSHSSLLTMCGRVFVWGDSSLGRLGVITSNLSSKVPKQQTFPLEIPLFKSLAAKALAAGDLHMLALVDDESNNGKGSAVYSWGYGGDGQTGHSTLLNVRTPKRIEFLDGMDVVSIGCGYSWSMAITGGGKLLTWGYGDGGWLGMRPPTDMIRVETDTPMAANLSPHIEITSFDSTHNVVIPHRVRFLSDWCVTEARGGGAHTVVFCSEKPAVATTAGDSWGSNEDADDDRKEPRSIDKQERQNRKSRNRLYDINSDSGSDIESYSELSGEKGEQQNSVSSKYDVKKDRGDDSQISKPLSSSGTDSMTARVMYLCRCQNMVELAAVLQGQGSGSDSGALVNCKEASTGNTPLIVACQSGHLDVCKLLIEHGKTTWHDIPRHTSVLASLPSDRPYMCFFVLNVHYASPLYILYLYLYTLYPPCRRCRRQLGQYQGQLSSPLLLQLWVREYRSVSH